MAERTDPWAAPEVGPRRGAVVGAVALATVAGAYGPALRLATQDQAALALACALAALGAAGATVAARRGATIAAVPAGVLAVGAVVAAHGAGGSSSAGLAAAGAALGSLALAPWRRGPSAATAGGPVRLGLGLVVAAGAAWWKHEPLLAAGLLAASAGLLAVTWAAPTASARLDRAVARGIAALTRWIAAAIVLLAALPTLYLPGAILSWRARGRRQTWRPRDVDGAALRRDATVPFASTPARERRRRQRWALVVAASLLPAVLIVRWQRADPTPEGRPIEFGDWAFPDEPWVDELYDAGFGVTYHPSLQWKSTDVDTRYLQVRDGVRRSWEPDEDGRLTVWFLGGSALWGLGQRDDRTIPSEIAKLAAADGTPIEVVNLGVPGYTQWQQEAAMGFRLSRGERPDLVVSYDGANDLTAMIYRAGEGIEPLDEPPNRFHEQLERDTRYPPELRGDPADDDELVRTFLRMYGAGVDLTARTADAYGVPTAFYWQPQYLSTEPSPVDAPLLDAFPMLGPEQGRRERELIARVRAELPEPVVDLGSALDDAGAPTWFDSVHTNELGAHLVAEQMWTTLGPQIEALAAPG
ncbi:MAG: SGNH/GDSL hydrolase family protein [Acidimicrobiales bacterium]